MTETETKTFYALTNGFSTDRFKSEKPTEVPEDCTVEEREVVWNPELEKLTEGFSCLASKFPLFRTAVGAYAPRLPRFCEN